MGFPRNLSWVESDGIFFESLRFLAPHAKLSGDAAPSSQVRRLPVKVESRYAVSFRVFFCRC
eukprot:228996-Hanusia_phi.AAC.10